MFASKHRGLRIQEHAGRHSMPLDEHGNAFLNELLWAIERYSGLVSLGDALGVIETVKVAWVIEMAKEDRK